MDHSTLEGIADLICGDFPDAPTYRTGGELTRFFHRAGIRATHDGSTRKWWTLQVLQRLDAKSRAAVIKRLASPKEYAGDPEAVRRAMDHLNRVLALEGFRVELKGVEPKIAKLSKVDFSVAAKGLKPLPPPDFAALGLAPGIGGLMKLRWEEAQRCLDAQAYLAAMVMMGGLLEGLLLSVLQKQPKQANQSASAPTDGTGRVKQFRDWTLSEMIDAAHGLGWIGLDVKKFSHALREFRNLIHPAEQLALSAAPDKDSCGISWLVVQAAVNDLARVMAGGAVKASHH